MCAGFSCTTHSYVSDSPFRVSQFHVSRTPWLTNIQPTGPLTPEYSTSPTPCPGTAGVTVAGILGAIKLKNPAETDLIGALKKETFLFHGAGAANIGTISLLRDEGGVPMSRLHITNSRGIIWKSADGTEGSWRNDQQKVFSCSRILLRPVFRCHFVNVLGGDAWGGSVVYAQGYRMFGLGSNPWQHLLWRFFGPSVLL